MIDPVHLLTYVIRPVLKDLGLDSPEAQKLVLGTACQESQCGRWLRQVGTGPALGIYQMEPATHDDIWANYLRGGNRWGLVDKISNWIASEKEGDYRELVWNIAYATAMCRIHYLRVPEAIPHDLPGQAAYYKKYYNTELGAAKPEEYIAAWYRFVPAGVV